TPAWPLPVETGTVRRRQPGTSVDLLRFRCLIGQVCRHLFRGNDRSFLTRLRVQLPPSAGGQGWGCAARRTWSAQLLREPQGGGDADEGADLAEERVGVGRDEAAGNLGIAGMAA